MNETIDFCFWHWFFGSSPWMVFFGIMYGSFVLSRVTPFLQKLPKPVYPGCGYMFRDLVIAITDHFSRSTPGVRQQRPEERSKKFVTKLRKDNGRAEEKRGGVARFLSSSRCRCHASSSVCCRYFCKPFSPWMDGTYLVDKGRARDGTLGFSARS